MTRTNLDFGASMPDISQYQVGAGNLIAFIVYLLSCFKGTIE